MDRTSVAADVQRTAPPPLAVRLCRALRLRPPGLVRYVAIRVGPELIDTLRARRLARIADRRDEGDRFTPACREVADGPRPCDATCRVPRVSPAEAIRAEQAAARAERNLARAEIALARARVDASHLAAEEVDTGRDTGVTYGLTWSPGVTSPGHPPVHVVHVPGVVRAYVAPTGRLVDVML